MSLNVTFKVLFSSFTKIKVYIINHFESWVKQYKTIIFMHKIKHIKGCLWCYNCPFNTQYK